MTGSGSLRSFGRVLAAFFVYSVAVQATEAVFGSLYLRAAAALFATLVVVLSIDAVPALARGEVPTFDEGSYFYSARGILTVITFVLLAAVFADVLRTATALSERLSVVVAAFGAAVLVFGCLVAYYRRRHRRAVQVG